MAVEVHVYLSKGFSQKDGTSFIKHVVKFENNQQLIEKNIAEKDNIYFALRLQKSNKSNDKRNNIEKWKEIIFIYKAYLVEVDDRHKHI